MISLAGNRDEGRLRLGGMMEGEMDMEEEETEIEEGEACSYRYNEHNVNDDYDDANDDVSIDPDVALSYIDEKLHNVLGHFQKDFEGGVSAENLGAKFGGYGSFLPTHKRSPVCSQPKTPPKVQNQTPRSPSSLQLGVGHHLYAVCSSSPLSVKHGSDTSNVAVSSGSCPNDSIIQDISTYSAPVQGSAARAKAAKKSANLPDLKSLKLRIKVGSDNLLTGKHAAIYSGLGLDMSPSSSIGDSPTESEGGSHEPQNEPFESPDSILRIMTSFTIPGGRLLSPLPDDLVFLAGRLKRQRERRSSSVPKGRLGSPIMLTGSNSSIDGKSTVQVKMKPAERNVTAVESNMKNAHRKAGITSDKEGDTDALACDELVSQALKLPLLSTLSHAYSNSVKGMDNELETFTAVVKNASSRSVAKEQHRDSISAEVVTGKGDKTLDMVKSESNILAGKRAPTGDVLNPQTVKTDVKDSEESVLKLSSVKEETPVRVKKKSKGVHSVGTLDPEVPTEVSVAGSSSLSKTKKEAISGSHVSKFESINIRLQKDTMKGRDRYKDFFGDMEHEQDENEVDSRDSLSEGKLNDPESVSERKFVPNNFSKERLNVKKTEKPLMSEAYKKSISRSSVPTSGPLSNSVSTAMDPVVNKDNWVCCDKCLKWRLLPTGTSLDSLPEKWLCSMLDWLPGMNRCSISEDETTKAVGGFYQVPVSENPADLHGHGVETLSGPIPSAIQHAANCINKIYNGLPSSEKKKYASVEVLDPYNSQTSVRPASLMKTFQSSGKSRSLNEVNRSPLLGEQDNQHVKVSNDLAAENPRQKEDKQKVHENSSDGGDTRNSKRQNKRGSSQDSVRVSKKRKGESIGDDDDDETWMYDHHGSVKNEGPSQHYDSTTDLVGKDCSRFSDSSHNNCLKCEKRDNLDDLQKDPKKQVPISSDGMAYEKVKSDSRDKKRKEKESHDLSLNRALLQSPKHYSHDSGEGAKEYSDNEHKKDKKAKLPLPDVRESSLSKSSPSKDRRGSSKVRKVSQDPVSSQQIDRSLDQVDSLKKDFPSVQPSAANSSSSKVSSSQRTKISFQDMKGSPVESVSSSPLRPHSKDKYTSGASITEKGEVAAAVSPRKCSDGENDGVNYQSGTDRKEKNSTFTDLRSLESPFPDQASDHGRRNISSSSDHHFVKGSSDSKDQQYKELQTIDRYRDEEQRNDTPCHANGSLSKKSMRGSSSRSKDVNRRSRSEFGKDSTSGTFDKSKDHSSAYGEKSRDGRTKSLQEYDHSQKVEKKYSNKRDPAVKRSSDNSKRTGQLKSGRDGQDVKMNSPRRKDALSNLKQNFMRDKEAERSDKIDQVENCSVAVKPTSLMPQRGVQSQSITGHSQQMSGSHKTNAGNTLLDDTPDGFDEMKGSTRVNKVDNPTVSHLHNSSQQLPNGHRVRDFDAPSPARRDVSNQAAGIALKEAKNLKHMADRMQNSGLEKTGLYFEAALKFLHGASLLESSNTDNARHGDIAHFTKVYSSTADLCNWLALFWAFASALADEYKPPPSMRCIYMLTHLKEYFSDMSLSAEGFVHAEYKPAGFCAQEYEKFKNMAAAALAYKCTEVAYFRVIYSLHNVANRDRHELLTAQPVVPSGESPSSSASDVDNLNNLATIDKIAAKDSGLPQVAGSHVVIPARNRPNFDRLLSFAQDVNNAMEASRKSQCAFAAAKVSLDVPQHRDSIKKALDHYFQDMEGLLRLVRLAMEVINH